MEPKDRSDFDKFKDLFTQVGVEFEIPKKDDGTPCNDLINIGGLSVAGAQLITIKFYEDGRFKEVISYPNSVFYPNEEQEDKEPDCSDCKHYRYFVGEAYCNKGKPEYPFDADVCLDFTHE